MAETTTTMIAGKMRQGRGKKANRRVREEGWLPGIIYGHGQDPVAVLLPTHELEVALRHGAHVLTVNLENGSEQVLVKDVQWDHLGSSMVHVDLTRVSLDERVEVTVPIVLRGTPKGAAEGGVLEQVLSDLHVECVVTQIPESIRVSVADLGLNQVLHVRDLPLQEGMRAVNDPDTVVCLVRELGEEAAATETEAEASPAEPELIRRERPAEDEEEQG